MLAAVLEQPARARLNTIACVNPAKAQQVEMILMNMMQQGQLRGKVDEPTLVRLLEQVNAEFGEKKAPKITLARRRDSSDEESSDGSDPDDSD